MFTEFCIFFLAPKNRQSTNQTGSSSSFSLGLIILYAVCQWGCSVTGWLVLSRDESSYTTLWYCRQSEKWLPRVREVCGDLCEDNKRLVAARGRLWRQLWPATAASCSHTAAAAVVRGTETSVGDGLRCHAQLSPRCTKILISLERK